MVEVCQAASASDTAVCQAASASDTIKRFRVLDPNITWICFKVAPSSIPATIIKWPTGLLPVSWDSLFTMFTFNSKHL